MKPVSEILQGGVADSPITDLVRRSSSPQVRHHFTRADQVNLLVSAREVDPDLGFMARLLALCSLPPQHQPRQSASVQVRQRPLQAGHGGWRG